MLHSLLIWPSVSVRLQSFLGLYRFHFRLFYNLLSSLMLLPVMALTIVMRGDIVFSWEGPWIVIRLILVVLSIWLFKDGAQQYDVGFMLGIRQIQQQRQNLLLGKDDHFSRKGALGITRHPWYLGSLLILWSLLPVYRQSSVVAAAVLSIYLVVGTLLEERKLVLEYGEKYQRYQQEVSMFIPWKWLMKFFQRGR